MTTTQLRRWAAALAALLLATLLLPLGGPATAAPEPAPPSAVPLVVDGLTTERAESPLGLDVAKPRLGWEISSAARGVLQQAYQLRVATSTDTLESGPTWDSGRVTSGQSTGVAYGGPALQPRTRYVWQVRVWDTAGRTSAWSAPASWETGLMDPAAWDADWIGMPSPTDGWTDYTVETTVRVEKDAAGIFFRAKGSGNAYMWQLSTTNGTAKLRPHVRTNGAWSVLKEVPLSAVIPSNELTEPHRLRIALAGNTFTTSVDGTQVDVTTNGTHRAGSIGLRASGVESAVYSDLTVTSGDRSLFAASLTDGDNPFSAGTPTESGLQVAGDTEAMLAALDAAPLLRRDFSVDGEVARARLYASALGNYQLSLNGERVGDHELAPGWTDYNTRVQYQTYDVTHAVRRGDNAIGAALGDGWYAGTIASFGANHYGDRPHLIARLEVEYADGRSEVLTTDDSWQATPGPFLQTDTIHGETFDARRLPAGWDTPGFEDATWDPATVDDTGATAKLVAQADPPVRVVQELPARTLTQPAPGTWIFDLGQNMVGKVRLKVDGPAGRTVRIRHAEVLNPDGTAYTANLRSARATDLVTLRGGGPEVYEPTFTFHGFRYVELTGFPGTPSLGTVTGLVMHTDGALTSEFGTSDPMVNKLQNNITWGQRGNFLSIPTDTPARDERLGWTGDINVFAPTATFNMDSQTFLTKWLQDLRDAQSANGAYPDVAPRRCCGDGNTGWADAGITVPHTLWQRYGDTRVVEQSWASMVRYADWLERTSSGNRRTNGGAYLDWLNLDDPTPSAVIATAYYAYVTRLLGEMGAAIGKDAEAARYAALSKDIAAAFVDTYVADDGTVQGDSQTGYVLAIGMDLLPDDLRSKAADNLVANVARHDWHLATGFLGTPDLLPALSETGHLDVAYRLLTNDTYPSWGYEIAKGATTIWERWNSIMPDGSFGDVSMNSFNHYAYGAVGDWMYRTVAGIQPEAQGPGYGRITFAPQPGGGLTHARASYESVRGTVSSAWRLAGDGAMSLDVTVPGNATATVRVPAPSRWAVTEGGRPAEEADGVQFVRMDDGVAVYEIGSGDYRFAVDRVRGDLGDAASLVTDLADLVDRLAAEGGIDKAAERHLSAQVDKLARDVQEARTAYAAGRAEDAARQAHRALATADDMVRWVTAESTRTGPKKRAVTAGAAAQLIAAIDRVTAHLSAASSRLVGAVAALDVPVGERLPGDTFRATVRLTNGGERPLTGITSALVAPTGWTVKPAGGRAATAARGATVNHAYDVTLPANQQAGTVALNGAVAYRYKSGTATLPLSGSVTVLPAVEIRSATAEPASVAPGGAAVLSTVLHNRSSATVAGSLTTTAPDGWQSDQPAAAYTLAPGEQHTLMSRLTAPLSVTEGPAAAIVATGATDAERLTVPVSVQFANPPSSAYDHVDLGQAASEQAHDLVASEHSGTNTEAGLTRRYTNVSFPGGYFEFDLEVAPGEPFLLRSVETYDRAQLKDYDVLVDGVVVHHRAYQRTASGLGSLGYQFAVDQPEATADGTVRVRFLDVGTGYDPSIADVWSTPVG